MSAFRVGTDFAVFLHPVHAESILEFFNFFFCEDSNFLAFLEIPNSIASKVIFIWIRAPNLEFVAVDERSYKGSHSVSSYLVTADHLGNSDFLTNEINSVDISNNVLDFTNLNFSLGDLELGSDNYLDL